MPTAAAGHTPFPKHRLGQPIPEAPWEVTLAVAHWLQLLKQLFGPFGALKRVDGLEPMGALGMPVGTAHRTTHTLGTHRPC